VIETGFSGYPIPNRQISFKVLSGKFQNCSRKRDILAGTEQCWISDTPEKSVQRKFAKVKSSACIVAWNEIEEREYPEAKTEGACLSPKNPGTPSGLCPAAGYALPA
jgi:hypothetical protein